MIRLGRRPQSFVVLLCSPDTSQFKESDFALINAVEYIHINKELE